MKRNKIISIITIFALVFLHVQTFATNLQVIENEKTEPTSISEPSVFADAAVLLDIGSNKILYEKNYKEKMYPASTTKLMTALVVLDNCNDLSTMVKVSYYAVHKVPYSYSIANLYPGEEFSIKDLLNALLIPSANDAAYVLAEYVANGGNNYEIDSSSSTKEAFENSQSKFAEMMNEKAKELGCENTHFVNPNGIHDENHYSTAYDLMLIGREAYTSSTIKFIAKTLEYSLNNSNIYTDETRVMKATNLLLMKSRKGYYEYANGLKTGYTEAAKSCIIASAQKDDRDLIAVILHSDNDESLGEPSREDDCKSLFEYGFNNFSNSTIIRKDDVADTITISNGTKETKSLNVLCQDDVQALMINGEELSSAPEIVITKSRAPISKDEVVGTISYTIRDEKYSSNLIAEHDVYQINYMFYIILIALAVFLLLLLLLIVSNVRRHRQKRFRHN